ncbi:MAG: helix-turn-helix domain-containing protein [Chloroflexota bacterium]
MPSEEGVPIAEAARLLGLSTEAVRKRIARHSLRGYKRGRQWYVLLDAELSGPSAALSGHSSLTSGQSGGKPDQNGLPSGQSGPSENNAYQMLVDTLRDEIAFLRQQLQAREEELRRKDTLMASLTQRLPVLPDRSLQEDQSISTSRRRLWSWLPW